MGNIFIYIFLILYVFGQITKPLTKDEQIQQSKFNQRVMVKLEELVFGEGNKGKSKCKHEIEMFWQKTLSSEIVQTPQIFDFKSDGKKEIILPTASQYLEVLKGESSKPLSGFPYTYSELASNSSSLLYDIDGDGRMEIVVFSRNGEIVFFKQDGTPLFDETIQLPQLSVNKFWYKTGLAPEPITPQKPVTGRKILQNQGPEAVQIGTEGYFSEDAKDSMDLIYYTPDIYKYVDQVNPLRSKFYKEQKTEKDQVLVDPHILSTPTIIDVDGDGNDEIVLAISYYFDKEFYSNPMNIQKVDVTVDISKYVAGQIVVWDIKQKKIKWQAHLDLTTDDMKLKALIYAPPTVADIDYDGSLEIIVGTGLGFVFVFDKNGKEKSGNFPITVGEIRSQVITEDINGDGNLELIVVDQNSNLVCFDYKGVELWEKRISGYVNKAPMIGDINGDGILDIIVGTSQGQVWAVRSDNGQSIENFPVRVNGPIHSSPLLINLNKDQNKKSLTVVISSDDGSLNFIDGTSGCNFKIDIGAKSTSQVLADDLTGTGNIDLLVSTTNGDLLLFGTSIPYHPMKAISSQISTVNGFTSREYYHGIYVSLRSRRVRDVVGDSFIIEFVIVDQRKLPSHIQRKYDVKISIGKRHIIYQKTYHLPGLYVERLPAPKERLFGTVLVEMVNEHHQVFTDSFSVSFNITFLRTLKWTVVIPVLLTFAYLIFLNPIISPILPN